MCVEILELSRKTCYTSKDIVQFEYIREDLDQKLNFCGVEWIWAYGHVQTSPKIHPVR